MKSTLKKPGSGPKVKCERCERICNGSIFECDEGLICKECLKEITGKTDSEI